MYSQNILMSISYPRSVDSRNGFTPEEEKTLKDLDYAFLAKNDAAMKEWWDKVFKG